MFDVRGSYDDAFYLMGAMISISGLMLFSIPFVQRMQKSKNEMAEQRDAYLGKLNVGSMDYLPVPGKSDSKC